MPKVSGSLKLQFCLRNFPHALERNKMSDGRPKYNAHPWMEEDFKKKFGEDIQIHLFHLYEAFETDADNFTSQLMRLMRKADNMNLMKLGAVYPHEAYVVRAWINGEVEILEFGI